MLSPCLYGLALTHAGICAALAFVLTKRMLTEGPAEDDEQQTRLVLLNVMFVGALAWPFVWMAVVGEARKLHTFLLFGLLWPLCVLGLDMRNVSARKVTHRENNVLDSLQSDANSLIGIAFAFGTLSLGGDFIRERRTTIMLVIFSLILCVAFVIPAPVDRRTPTRSSLVTAVAQRTLFHYASGFIITAMAVCVGSALTD
jgi:Ca2+/H+ antiporter